MPFVIPSAVEGPASLRSHPERSRGTCFPPLSSRARPRDLLPSVVIPSANSISALRPPQNIRAERSAWTELEPDWTGLEPERNGVKPPQEERCAAGAVDSPGDSPGDTKRLAPRRRALDRTSPGHQDIRKSGRQTNIGFCHSVRFLSSQEAHPILDGATCPETQRMIGPGQQIRMSICRAGVVQWQNVSFPS